MEDRIIGYLGKRFSDVDGENIKHILEKMQIDEKLLLKGISGKEIKCGKRSPDRPEANSLEGTPKRVKTSRNSSPLGRFEAKNTPMEVETNKGEEKSKNMEEEKVIDVEIKEEADKKLQESPALAPEEKDIMTASKSKKALIEYYEMKILKIKGLLTDKKEKKPEPVKTQNLVSHRETEGHTTQGNVEGQTQGQQEEPKREEQEEQTRQTVTRFEAEEQMANEQRNLSFDKDSANMNDTTQMQSQEEKRKERYMESEEKIEEDEGRGMVIWELRETGEAEKNLNLESMKEAGQENNIELLMKLLAMQPETTDEQKIEDLQPQRVEEEKKVEESAEKIEDATENKDGGQAEENSTKTEPKLEEQEQKTEEGAQNAKAKNAEAENRESINKKMRSAVENYLEMLQGRVDLTFSADNGFSTDDTEKNTNKEKMSEEKVVQDTESKKEEENNVKEESDQEKPQKLSVSKFFS